MAGRDRQAFVNDSTDAIRAVGSNLRTPAPVEWHDACKIPGMTNRHMIYRAAAEVAPDEDYVDQTRRRAARWHAWLKSPYCKLQDRENFERWCADPANAAAYVAFCGDLAAVPELAVQPEESSGLDYGARALAFPGNSPRLEADTR